MEEGARPSCMLSCSNNLRAASESALSCVTLQRGT